MGLVFGNRECFGFQGSLISSGVPKALGQLVQEFRNRNPNRSRVFSKMVCYLRSYSEKYLWKLYIIRRDRDFFTKRSSRNIKDHQRESRRFPSPPTSSHRRQNLHVQSPFAAGTMSDRFTLSSSSSTFSFCSEVRKVRFFFNTIILLV